ncbi:class I SAM-dependent methyltransferase [Paenibacillus sp. MMS18-CY102]|uniref:class I SAM-dependent methyltransferase n=1 Tax=Paenibacillus sp. MMS18-CY102 TaxID=2682849 RepID=UPI00136551FA|nr:SAM-dependent methyltransferase [Paenibacillus sp. MMS18-CY102]MWC27458.1 SAM-dependent methyltransferase [Paenibacillus sp. MMS18-CY102]
MSDRLETKATMGQKIREAIGREGVSAIPCPIEGVQLPVSCTAIPFQRYMEICLYDEQWGYYRSGDVRTGADGDFYTSAAIGGLMGELWARRLRELAAIQQGDGANVHIGEWGAGAGAMSGRMLDYWVSEAPQWLASIHFFTVDDHLNHVAATRSRVNQLISGKGLEPASVQHMGSAEAAGYLKDLAEDAIVMVAANELLDAMPVHRIAMHEGNLMELGVYAHPNLEGSTLGEGKQPTAMFGYAYMPLSTPALAASLEADGVPLLEGQETEMNLAAEAWLAQMGQVIRNGMLLIFDYGHEAEEYRAEHRMKGTLLCYKRHIAHDDPFLAPGEQDLTAHINFTAMMRAARRAGWEVAYMETQKQFLLDEGILQLLSDDAGRDPFSETAKRNRAIRQLLLSDNMSETFKVMVLTKGSFRWASNGA